MRTRFLLAPALLLVTFSAHAADPPKACTLLTQQAAAALLGSPVKPPMDANIACIFQGANGTVNINLLAMPGAPQGTMAKAYANTLHKDYATDTVESVPGLGEQNRVIVSSQKITVEVLYHETILGIIVTNSTNRNLKAAMIQTAKQALTKF